MTEPSDLAWWAMPEVQKDRAAFYAEAAARAPAMSNTKIGRLATPIYGRDRPTALEAYQQRIRMERNR